MMSFFLALFQGLRVQMGVPFAEQTIQTFMNFFTQYVLFLTYSKVWGSRWGYPSQSKPFRPSWTSLLSMYYSWLIPRFEGPDGGTLRRTNHSDIHELLYSVRIIPGLFKGLRVQMGLPFAEQTVKIFMKLITKCVLFQGVKVEMGICCACIINTS